MCICECSVLVHVFVCLHIYAQILIVSISQYRYGSDLQEFLMLEYGSGLMEHERCVELQTKLFY